LVYFSLYPPSGIIFNSIHNYLEIMFPIDVLKFAESYRYLCLCKCSG